MRRMDTTQVDRLLTELDAAEPAEAPDLADRLAVLLSGMLERGGTEDRS
jgi:hypothetical protein